MFVSEFAGDVKFNGVTITDHTGLNFNKFLQTGVTGSLGLNLGTVST